VNRVSRSLRQKRVISDSITESLNVYKYTLRRVYRINVYKYTSRRAHKTTTFFFFSFSPRWSIACFTPVIDTPFLLLRGSTRLFFLFLDSDDNPKSFTNIYVILLSFFTIFLSSDLKSRGG
jgi:hypothetical protein